MNTAVTRCFEGYLAGPVEVLARADERRFRAEHLDPFASRCIPWTARPSACDRRSTPRLDQPYRGDGRRAGGSTPGLGRRAMREAIRDAESRGDRAIVLEVFEQNEPAFDLYAGLGFETRRGLVGYRRRG